jgi:hypothetical protein
MGVGERGAGHVVRAGGHRGQRLVLVKPDVCQTTATNDELSARLTEDLPIIPHGKLRGVDCCGCFVVAVTGNAAELYCNEPYGAQSFKMTPFSPILRIG